MLLPLLLLFCFCGCCGSFVTEKDRCRREESEMSPRLMECSILLCNLYRLVGGWRGSELVCCPVFNVSYDFNSAACAFQQSTLRGLLVIATCPVLGGKALLPYCCSPLPGKASRWAFGGHCGGNTRI
nr:hypothetical protein [uncultured bacterium]